MRIQDIKIGKTYRFKAHPSTGYAKVIAILRPKEGENNNNYSVVKCQHTTHKNGDIGFIRYFKPSVLVRGK